MTVFESTRMNLRFAINILNIFCGASKGFYLDWGLQWGFQEKLIAYRTQFLF